MTEWTAVVNRAADGVGGIHHDETARAKGFPAALVPADELLALTVAAAIDRLGGTDAWYAAITELRREDVVWT